MFILPPQNDEVVIDYLFLSSVHIKRPIYMSVFDALQALSSIKLPSLHIMHKYFADTEILLLHTGTMSWLISFLLKH